MALSAQCRVYIAFADGPLVASPTWTEVSAHVREVRTSRGRSNELDDFAAGTCTVVLDNRTRQFDPDYSAGPYFGDLLPRRQIKVEAVHAATTYPIFRGLVQSWVQGWPVTGRDATCTVQATDLFGLLATWDLPETAHELTVRSLSPTAFWGLDDEDSVCRDRLGGSNGSYGSLREKVGALEVGGAGASKHATASGVASASTTATTGFGDQSSSASTSIAAIMTIRDFVQDYDGVVAFDVSIGAVTLLVSAGVEMYLGADLFGAPTAVVNTTQITGAVQIRDGSPHHLCLVRSGANATLYVDGASVASTAGAPASASTLRTVVLGSGPSGTSIFNRAKFHDITVDEAAVWHGTALSAGNVALLAEAVGGWVGQRVEQRMSRMLDLLGVPSALYSLQLSSISVGVFEGGTDALSYFQSLARSDQGRLFVSRAGVFTFEAKTDDMGASSAATFADDATANAVRYTGFELELDDRLIYNEVTVAGVGDAVFTARNAASIATYSRRGLTRDTELPSGSACQDVAEAFVARYAAPATRGRSWTVAPERTLIGSASLGYATVLGRELGDVVTVRRTPPLGTAVSKTVQITSIGHEIDLPEGRWSVTFAGAPVDTTSSFRWATSNWGGSDGWS